MSEIAITIAMWCSTSSTVSSNSSRIDRDELAELVDLGVGEPGRGLVEQQQPRAAPRARGRSRRASACRTASPAARRSARCANDEALEDLVRLARRRFAVDEPRASTRRRCTFSSDRERGEQGAGSGRCGRSRPGRCGAPAARAGRDRRTRCGPTVGSYSRLTQLNSVVLPAPLGPISAADLAVVDGERQVGRARRCRRTALATPRRPAVALDHPPQGAATVSTRALVNTGSTPVFFGLGDSRCRRDRTERRGQRS